MPNRSLPNRSLPNRSLPNRSLPNRSSPNRARRWVIEAIDHAWGEFPLPIAGIDSDNGSEFINHHFLHDCETRKITLRLGLRNQIRALDDAFAHYPCPATTSSSGGIDVRRHDSRRDPRDVSA